MLRALFIVFERPMREAGKALSMDDAGMVVSFTELLLLLISCYLSFKYVEMAIVVEPLNYCRPFAFDCCGDSSTMSSFSRSKLIGDSKGDLDTFEVVVSCRTELE